MRPVALMLVVLLVGAAPVRAADITFEDVVRAVGANGQVRAANEVRLRFAAQDGRAAGQSNAPAQTADSTAPQQQSGNLAGAGGGQVGTSTPAAGDPTLSQSGGQVETIDLGDVTGTVCDCGEIPIAEIARRGGGFPWWLLGGIPLICVSGVCFDSSEECEVNCEPTTPPTPTPTPPPNPVPEPATLLLFGSGLLALGARARRRYGRKEFDDETAAAAGEV
jgi:PEP-CTERM motif